jgi:hypothetical protein
VPYRRSLAVLVACLGLLGLPAAAQSVPEPAQISHDASTANVLQPSSEIEIGGRVSFDAVRIPAGVTVWVGADLELSSLGDIVIEGALIARPGVSGRSGPSIELRTPGVIHLGGTLMAGDGGDGVLAGQAGGRGGSLLLEAAAIVTRSDLLGARGGHGGPGADGGDGGQVFVRGTVVPPAESIDVQLTLRGGAGGQGGAGLVGVVGGPQRDAAADRNRAGDCRAAPLYRRSYR